ncbi:hypothetical protein ACHAQH_009195 [Verticillium albo-atrum]
MPAPTTADTETERPLLAADERDAPETAADYGTNTPPAERSTFTRNLGAVEAFGIVVSIVIGSGVFTSPGAIDTNVPSPGAALVIWLLGGVLAWTGATTLAELGTAIPGEGGIQPYLQYIFGDIFGFFAAWTWIVAVMPATLAILSIVFVESVYSSAGVTDGAGRIEHKLLSILVLIVMSGANMFSTKASTRLNGFFVVTKFLSIFVVVVAGLVVVILQVANKERRDVGGRDWFDRPWFEHRETVNPDGSRTDWDAIGRWELLGHYSAALYGALWAYSGWDKAIYVSAELKSPAKQLPLAINSAIPTIIISFLAANAAYYILLPWAVVSTTDSVAVVRTYPFSVQQQVLTGQTSLTRLLGPSFGIAAAALICLVVAGSLLGNSFVASRMAVAAANKNWLPRLFTYVGRVSLKPSKSTEEAPTSDAPINAIILSAVLAAVYILLGNFRALLTFNGLGEYTFFFLTVLGAIILRWREPGLERPYKPFVLVPVIFALVSGFVVVRGAVFAPVQAGVLVGVWALGLVFYWAKKRWFDGRDA